MYGAISIQSMINNIKTNVNQYTSAALFPDSFIVSRIKQGYDKIYRYTKWYWTVVKEEIMSDVIDAETDTFVLSYSAQNVMRLTDGDNNEYTRVIEFTYDTNSVPINKEFRVERNKIILNQSVKKINIVYRRYPVKPSIDNLQAEIDVPPEYEDVLEMVAISKMLHIWLGEGVSQMAANFRNDTEQELLKLSKIDSYDNPTKQVKSIRRSATGKIV